MVPHFDLRFQLEAELRPCIVAGLVAPMALNAPHGVLERFDLPTCAGVMATRRISGAPAIAEAWSGEHASGSLA